MDKFVKNVVATIERVVMLSYIGSSLVERVNNGGQRL
jgi:hypothetical protein